VLIILGTRDFLPLEMLAGIGRKELDLGVGIVLRMRDEVASGAFGAGIGRAGGTRCTRKGRIHG
jgi:hypothetical protein